MTTPPRRSRRAPKKVKGIESRQDAEGYWTHSIRVPDPLTGRRGRVEFDDIEDAIDYQAKMRLAKRAGDLAELTAGRETIEEFFEGQYWELKARVELEENTLKVYESMWRVHLRARVGGIQLRRFNAQLGSRLRKALEDDGVGPATIVKAMTVLQSMFAAARTWDRIAVNPMVGVPKPYSVSRSKPALLPVVVEEIREHLDADGRMLVDLLGYQGMRPEEALALQYEHERERTFLIEQVNVNGKIRPGTKVRGKPERTVKILAPVREDLAAHRRRGGVLRHGKAYVIAREDGSPWSATDYRNWRARRWQRAAAAAGVATFELRRWTEDGRRRERRSYDGPTPYGLRHAAATIRIYAGDPLPTIANELGHDEQTLVRYYTHLFSELEDQPKIPMEEQIRSARAERALLLPDQHAAG